MNSTTTSNILVDLKDINIVFNVDYHPLNSLRDQFTNLLTHPYDYFFKEKERFHVIKNLNLKVNKGDRLGILGVNGAGKTSLCRCIMGMYTPRSGTVKINGTIRAIFSTGLGIMPELTGRENARLLARLIYGQVKNIDAVIEDCLEFSELKNFVDTPFKYYSKGMQTRLFLSVVSALPSDVLILDEVFDGADASFSRKISQRIKKIINDSQSVIFVSHSEEHVRHTCNRVIVINNNALEYDGDVEGGINYYRTQVLKI